LVIQQTTTHFSLQPKLVQSIEIYKFGDDGSLHTSTFWDLSIGNEYSQWTKETEGELLAHRVTTRLPPTLAMRAAYAGD
jgi:hypothetical protein